jgi:multidrug efflux pump subunit AcrB
MWLVNLALRNPYTIYVAMLLTLVLGSVSYERTPTDILPKIKMPVVVVFASYRGMPAPDMEKSVTSVLERALTRCDHLAHLESKSLLGIGIVKVYFREHVDPDVAASQARSSRWFRAKCRTCLPACCPPACSSSTPAPFPSAT